MKAPVHKLCPSDLQAGKPGTATVRKFDQPHALKHNPGNRFDQSSTLAPSVESLRSVVHHPKPDLPPAPPAVSGRPNGRGPIVATAVRNLT